MASIDASLQDPPDAIFEMLGKFEAGAGIAFDVRRSREPESPFKLMTVKLDYRRLHENSRIRTMASDRDRRQENLNSHQSRDEK